MQKFARSYLGKSLSDFLQIWYIAFLSRRVPPQLTHSHAAFRKRSSITAKVMGLIYAVQCHFIMRHVFLPTLATPILASCFYQSLPLISFVLHSFLRYYIGDDLWYAHYGFSVGPGQVQCLCV